MDREVSGAEVVFRDEVRGWLLANLPAGWDATSTRTLSMAERLEDFGRAWEARLFDVDTTAARGRPRSVAGTQASRRT